MAEAAGKARVALVTGGVSGIGLATAELLLASGWKVAVIDRDEKELEVPAGEVLRQSQRPRCYARCDR